MNEETEKLFDKAARVIDTSRPQHRQTVARYLSLMNKRLNSADLKDEAWAVVGASYGIKERYEKKFGLFVPESRPVRG